MSVQATEASDSSGLTSWLLRVVATLSPDGIPRAFLDGLPQAQPRSRLARLRPWRGAPPRGMGDLVDQCVAGSLLDLTATGDTVVMHRLVARVLRERDKARGRWTSTVMCAVNLLEPLLFPEELAWSRREDGVRLAAQIEPLREADIETSGQVLAVRLRQIRFWADQQVSAKADEEAIDAGTSTLADREQMLGTDHLDTLASRDSLADAYREAGRPSAAIPLYERTLADRERLLGTDHPDTLKSRHSMSWRSGGPRRFRCSNGSWPTATACRTPTTHARSNRGRSSHRTTGRRTGWPK
jgi:Tetratricopeptide repeat